VRQQDRRSFPAPVAEAPGLATFATLKGHMCKWPIGDPSEHGFTFCGHAASPGRPYCARHSYAAYRPTSMASRETLEKDVTRLMRRVG
jgi:GcrA cell cycle regulator